MSKNKAEGITLPDFLWVATSHTGTRAGLVVGDQDSLLNVAVHLPEKFLTYMCSLLGRLTINPLDNFNLRSGWVLSLSISAQWQFQFKADWIINNGSSLFMYDLLFLVHNFLYWPKHNLNFWSLFPSKATLSPSQAEVAKLCGYNHFFTLNTLATGSLSMGPPGNRAAAPVPSTELAAYGDLWLALSEAAGIRRASGTH